MRTQEEIVQHYRKARDEDFLGFTGEVLLNYLTFDMAKEFLKEDASPDWGEVLELGEETIIGEMCNYMEFAWDKAYDHKGISAGRSIEKMSAWLWLLGDDEMVAFAEDDDNYENYGCPILWAICKKYGFSIPDSPVIERMSKGLPCTEGCNEGCGH